MTDCCPDMALPDAGLPNGHDIDGLLKKRALLQPLDMQLQRRRKTLQIKGAKGLFQRQAALSQQAFRAPFLAERFFSGG